MGSLDLMVKSMLELRQLDPFSRPGSPRRGYSTGQLLKQTRSTASLDSNMRRSARRHAHPHSAWLAPASSPEPEGVVLYPVLCPSTGSLHRAYPVQGENTKHKGSPDCGSSTGYGSGGSSPEQDHGDSDDPEPLSTDDEHFTPEEEDESTRRRPFHQIKTCKPECFFTEPLKNLANNSTGSCGSISASFLSRASTARSLSQFQSKSSRKSERSHSFHSRLNPLVSTIHPKQKGMDQVMSQDKRSEEPKQLRSTPKWTKDHGVKDVARAKMASPIGKPLLKSMSAHNLVERRKSANVSQLKKESQPPLPDLLTDKSNSGVELEYTALTRCLSPQPYENTHSRTRRLKMRSYMSPTTSFKAKVSRSFSLGEGLHLNLHSGQSSPSSQSPTSSTSAYTPPPSTPPPGPSVLRVSHGECQTREVRTKSHVLGLMSRPVSEYPSCSAAMSSSDAATQRDSYPVNGDDQKFLVSLTSSANDGHKILSYPPQQPLLSVLPFDVTKESPTALEEESSVTVETCRQAASDLYSSVKNASQLFKRVNTCVEAMASEQYQEMKHVLMKALFTAQCELQSVPGLFPMEGLMGSVGGERTLALLEQYSQLLLQSVERRLEHKT